MSAADSADVDPLVAGAELVRTKVVAITCGTIATLPLRAIDTAWE